MGNLSTTKLNFSFFIAKKTGFRSSSPQSGLVTRIAVSVVASSLAIMIISVAVVFGFKKEINKKVSGFNADIQLMVLNVNNTFENPPLGPVSKLKNTITAIQGIKTVNEFVTKSAIINTGNDIQGIVLKGINKNYDTAFIHSVLTSGTCLTFLDSLPCNGLMVSTFLANKLRLNVGSSIPVFFIQQPVRVRKLMVTGIYETGMEDYDEIYAWCDIRHLQKINNWNDELASGLEINVTDPSQITRINEKINSIIDVSLAARTMPEIYPQIFDWLNLLDMNVQIIIILMILVAGISMVTTLLIIILEKTSMVGLLSALGSRIFQIQKVFLYKAGYLILTGMLLGNFVGIGACMVQQKFGIIRLPKQDYYMTTVPIHLTITDLLYINLGAFGICLLIMLLPVQLVARISPVKALRFD